MKRITKIKRSVRAISPVIATLLMIAIAVVASLVVYAWVTGYIGGTTSTAGKAIQIPSFALDPTSGNLVIYVQNVGQGDVALNQAGSVYVNGNLESITTPATSQVSIPVGQTIPIQVLPPAGYKQGDTINIKVATTDGTFMTTSGKATTTTIQPVSSLNPSSGPVGQSVTVSGSGFTPSTTLTATFDSSAITLSGTTTTDATGAFSGATFTVPTGTGAKTVVFTTGSTSGTSTFIITSTSKATPTVPAPTLNPSGSTTVGTSIAISTTVTGGSGTPTGTVQFQVKIGTGSWTNIGTTVALVSGQASTSYTPSTADSYQFQAIYNGDTTYNGATSGATSLTVTAAASPTVVIAPAGPFTMDAGQTMTLTATPSGGTGTIHYQWYVGAGTVGTDSSSYTYTASGSSASITCKVTDSSSPPVTSPASNAVTITVNAAMSTPSITPAGPLTMTAGNTQTFTLGTVTGGSGAKTNQWYLDGSAVGGQTGTTYTYTGATTGSPHSVYCQVTDTASTPISVNSNTVSITVNAALIAPTLDVSNTASTAGATSYTVSLPATKANDIIYVAVSTDGGHTATISATGLTFVQRQSAVIYTGTNTRTLQTFWALKTTAGTITLTVNLNGYAASSVEAFAVNGANTASPFDVTTPSKTSGTGTAPSTTITTTTANDFIIGAVGVHNNPYTITAGTGFTMIGSVTTNDPEVGAEYKAVTTTLTNSPVGSTLSGTGNDWAIIADAIKGP